jgi:thiol-disulfide isomerase/thioredoxin
MEKEIDDFILSYDGFIFIMFTSLGCNNCEDIFEKLKAVSRKRLDIKIFNVDADERPEILNQYSVAEIPSLLIYCGNILIHFIVGNENINNHLKEVVSDIDSEK